MHGLEQSCTVDIQTFSTAFSIDQASSPKSKTLCNTTAQSGGSQAQIIIISLVRYHCHLSNTTTTKRMRGLTFRKPTSPVSTDHAL